MFGGELILSYTATIETDPGAGDNFHLFKAPRALTILDAYMTSDANLGAGTAITLSLHNWGTGGTAVEGTIAVANGTGLTADTPLAATLTAAQQYIDQGEWLVLNYAETGGGWQSGDRVALHFNYVLGKGN